MSALVLAALRRKLVMYEAAGLPDKADRVAEQIAWHEAEASLPTPEPDGTIDVPLESQESVQHEAHAPAGVDLTPAAQARADELGLKPEDFEGFEPSGKGGQFLVGDVERIAEARDNKETDTDGDDELS